MYELVGFNNQIFQLSTFAYRVERPYECDGIGANGDVSGNGGILNGDIVNSSVLNGIGNTHATSQFTSNGSNSNIESLKIRRENILSELTTTESRYVMDLKEVLINYRDKLAVSNLTETRQRANTIFGNLGT